MAYADTKPKWTAQLLTRPQATLVGINAYYGLSSDQIIVTDYDVITSEIYNVLTTVIGEEEWEPTYGSAIPNRLFDPVDNITAMTIKTDLYLALREWVPQITVDLAGTSVTPIGDGNQRGYDVVIAWRDNIGASDKTLINFRR